MSEPCPCGLPHQYIDCCGPIHLGARDAETAEQLMRSRYCAFVKELSDYLLESWHPEYRPNELKFTPGTKWLGLKVKETRHGQKEDSEGWVSFVARFKVAGKAEKIVESSYFCRKEYKWVYHSAVQ